MKMEKGKFYKTRDGRKVEIYNTSANHEDQYKVHANMEGLLLSYTSEVRFMPDGVDYCFDIVSEWTEPRRLAYLHLPSGHVVMSSCTVQQLNLCPSDYERLPHLDEPESKE